MKNKGFGYAQICLNGHIKYSNWNSEALPEGFCKECGEAVINKCLNCGEFIDGRGRTPFDLQRDLWLYSKDPYIIPKFCPHCGKAYPWTQRGIELANSLIDETSLTNEEKNDFKENISIIVRNAPATSTAAKKVRKYLQKIEVNAGEAIYKAFIDFSSSVAAKIITGG